MAIVTVLNRVFAVALQEGELDFLQDRTVYIHVHDMRLAFRITLAKGGLVPGRTENTPDLTITGSLHAFLLLATRHEDSDTLFFQRRLHTEGNTELGLEVKNFLDGLDVESLWLPGKLEALLQTMLPLYERVFG
jgi:predicted lipid carrier protein YhbT